MIDTPSCVICDSEIRRLRHAAVAPFLARRIWQRRPFDVDLVQCRECEFLFYNPRLDAAEESRLYADYRAYEYQKMRHASEPWYTPAFNADLGSPASYEPRRRTLAAILRQHTGSRAIARILDYGGDRGHLVRGLIEGAEPFVYEISGVPPAPGVTAVTDPAACRADLIVNSNVLEHVGFPRALVSAILQAAPPGGLVFLEVPCESPFGAGRLLRRVAQSGVVTLLRPRLAPFVLRPSTLFTMHEHVNYFTENTLSTLMRLCGGSVIAAGRYAMDGRAGKGEMVWCLGTA
jgi:hypothetical protein